MNEMIEQPDCLMVYDDPFDESCDDLYCEKYGIWLDECGVCYECKGEWSAKQINDYEDKLFMQSMRDENE